MGRRTAPTDLRARWRAALVWLCACHAPAPVRESRPPAAATSSEVTCGGCHRQHFEQWAVSWHRRSFTDADFQSSFAVDRHELCVSCHAPGKARFGELGANEGVRCVDCHDVAAGHGQRASARATTRPCAGCHDFPVPGTEIALQTTEREHGESPYAQVACVSCHAPQRSGVRDHRMAGPRSAEDLRGLIELSAARLGADRVEVHVRPVGIGHRFPTGDLFRRVRVDLVAEDAAGRMVGHLERSFRRDWDRHTRSLLTTRKQAAEQDTRLTAAGERLVVRTSAAAARVRVSMEYDRGRFGVGDELETFASIPFVDQLLPLGAASNP